MTQLQGFFEKNFTLSPDYCGASARMSPLAVFTMFQAIAAEHAERIGVGGAAMARRGAFWLTLHSRVDFFLWRWEKNFGGLPLFDRGRLSFCVIMQ